VIVSSLTPRSYAAGLFRSERTADSDLVEMDEQIVRILVDPERARVDQLLAPVTTGQNTDPERARPLRGEQVRDACRAR